MNVGSALGFPAALSSVKRTDVRTTSDESDAPRSAASTTQFAAFLSMIVSNNPRVRSDLLKQLPEDSAGLLDHLLAEGDVFAANAEDATSIFTTTPGAVAQLPSSALMTSALPFSGAPNALDAARYGLMIDTTRADVETTSVKPVSDSGSATAVKAKNNASSKIVITSADINTALLAEVRSTIAGMQSGTNNGIDYNAETSTLTKAGTQNRLSQAVLSRIASKKGVSVEEMMAVGDTEGAQARLGLDVLLAKAGTPDGMNIAAINAASNALSSALALSATNVGTPVKDTAALDPELQSRLMRVIDRMKNEFGHEVTVVETARSQERQNMLYEQGRTTPGSVVTWTKDSLHTQGEAVDLVVDGSWKNTQGFARLQQIAKEEGLHTIPNDPGHVELPRDSWSQNADVRVQNFSSNVPNTPTANGIARVATVARVASVASTTGTGAPSAPPVPQVAQPALPSTPLDASLGLAQQRQQGAGAQNASAQNASAQNASAQNASAQNGGAQNGSGKSSSSDESTSESNSRPSLKATQKANARPATAVLGDEASVAPSKFIGPVAEPQGAGDSRPVSGADRIQQIDTLRDTQSAKPISQITLDVEGPDGVSQQITVGVNGKVVDTHIAADSTSADRLRSHVNELRAGLESRGLEADTVRISTQGARANDAAEGVKTGLERDVARMQGTGNASTSSGDQSMHQGARDRSSSAREWEDKQAARDEQRAQNRDAQGRGSGNQDRQRPQYQEKK